MSDEQQAGQEATPQSNPTGTQQPGRLEDLPEAAQKMIKELRQEAASYRVELRKLQEAQQQRLAESGNFKELAEQRAAELAALQPFKEQAETLEKMIRESNTSRINSVREDMRALTPVDYSPAQLAKWLDANLTRLTTPPAPNIDAGAGQGGGTAVVRLTDEQKQMAARFGMTEAQYVESLKRAGNR